MGWYTTIYKLSNNNNWIISANYLQKFEMWGSVTTVIIAIIFKLKITSELLEGNVKENIYLNWLGIWVSWVDINSTQFVNNLPRPNHYLMYLWKLQKIKQAVELSALYLGLR